MEIYEKAKELGNMISESKEFLALRESEEAVINNQEALDLLNEFGRIREEYSQALSSNEDQSQVEAIKQNLIEKNEQLMSNTVTRTYIESKSKVDNIFKTVSDILLTAVNGAHEEGGGCSSGECGGCGGGCGCG